MFIMYGSNYGSPADAYCIISSADLGRLVELLFSDARNYLGGSNKEAGLRFIDYGTWLIVSA
jgi:hypothetical protein